MVDFIGYINGKPAEYVDAVTLLNKTTGREVTRVENAGVVKIQFTVATKNMQLFGF